MADIEHDVCACCTRISQVSVRAKRITETFVLRVFDVIKQKR